MTARERFGRLLNPILQIPSSPLFDLLCAVSRTPYEGRPCTGAIVFARPPDRDPKGAIVLAEPLATPGLAGLRKLMELVSRDRSLLFDGARFVGFYPATLAEAPWRVVFQSHGCWQVEDRGAVRLSVIDGAAAPALDNVFVLSHPDFERHLHRIFPSLGAERSCRIWNIATIALDQPFGTNILFTQEAHAESRRLAAQCIPVEPATLTPSLIRALAAIDGTTIADLDGRAHAFSAILDGDASFNGSWERGGRYNSAVNYLCRQKVPSLIVSVSQDGGVELLPPLTCDEEPWTQHRYLKLSSIVT